MHALNPAWVFSAVRAQKWVNWRDVFAVTRCRGSLLSSSPVMQHVWSESEDCLPFLQLAQDYISSCGKKTLLEVLEKVFTSFRPVREQSVFPLVCVCVSFL